MSETELTGEWQVEQRSGLLHLKAKRIGIVSINAKAPVVGGRVNVSASRAELVLEIALGEVKTGVPLLDPEVHSLVHKGSDGVLTYTGAGDAADGKLRFEGRAVAGNVKVPMSLVGSPQDPDSDTGVALEITGTATLEDVHIPLPGFGDVREIEMEVEALLKLVRR